MTSASHFRLKRPEPKEADVLSAVLTALAMHPRVAWAHRFNTAAGKLVRKSGASQWMKFGFPGCPDVLGMLSGGYSLLLEVKRPSGRVTELQESFIEMARAHGGCAAIVRGADEAVQVIEDFYARRH